MDSSGAVRALFARSQLAFTAAAALPGQFHAFERAGLLASATTATGLEFLNSIAQVTELSADGLPDILAVFAAMGAPMPSLSAAQGAGVALAGVLSDLGYEPGLSRCVAGVDLVAPSRDRRQLTAPPGGLTVTEVPAGGSTADHDRAFCTVLAAGYGGTPALTRFLLAEHASPDVRRFLAWHRGEPVAAAAMSVHDGVAVLGGAATLPQARRQGGQRALLQRRLDEARLAGCSAAAASAAPESPSERNLAAAGFTVWRRPTWRFAGSWRRP